MMLRFYSYFKQATEGKVKGKRPAFWDIVGRAKYDAWKSLGDMPEERAMELYVEELKKIVETMSYTDNVADFYGSIHELENVNINDLAMIAPETIRKQRSDPNSPIHSVEQSRTNSRDGSPTRISQNSMTDTSEDEEFIDTVDVC
jgi:acyl-CoA-binding protein